MELFAIATATVIGASFIAPNPAEARDRWILVGESKSGSFYAKLDKRTGQYADLSVNDTIDNEDTKWSLIEKAGNIPLRIVQGGSQ